MSSLSKTARLQISAVSLPEIPVCTGSPFLQRCWTLSCSNLPVLLSRLCRSQSQTAARPIRHRCLPDTGRPRRLFFCSFCGTRSVSVSRYGSHRFPAASAVLRATICFSFNSGTDTVRPSTWRAHSTKTWQACRGCHCCCCPSRTAQVFRPHPPAAGQNFRCERHSFLLT